MSGTRPASRAADPVASTRQNNDTGYAVDFAELIYNLLSGWKLIVLMALVCTLIAGVCTQYLVTPMYEATATLYALGSNHAALSFSDVQLGSALTQDYIKVFQLWEVHEKVIANLGLSFSCADMQDMLSVTNDANTHMISITVTQPDPACAAQIANEYAQVASQFIADTMSIDQPRILSAARLPSRPVSPNKAMNLAIGFAVGFFIACGWITLKTLMNDTYKTAEDIHKFTGWPTLAVLPQECTRHKKAGREA